MKILQLVDETWDSGLTAYALQVARLLKDHGDDVVMGVREKGKPLVLAKELGVKTAAFESLWGLKTVIGREAWDVINVHTGRMHTWTVLFELLGLTSRYGKGPAIIRTRADARPLRSNFLSRIVYRPTSFVITATDHLRNEYTERLGFPEDRIETIYPSVSARGPAGGGDMPLHRIGILGRLDVVKGHAFFLEAAALVLKEIIEVRFLIAGKEAGVSESLLKNQARDLGIENSVEFLGFVPSTDQFMESCGIGVVASIGSEEVSRACLEWMAWGRPVVGTLVGCLPELIEPLETGLLVPPEDSKSMAEALLKLLRDPEMAKSWGRNAQATALRRFSARTQLDHTLDVYKKAVDRSKIN